MDKPIIKELRQTRRHKCKDTLALNCTVVASVWPLLYSVWKVSLGPHSFDHIFYLNLSPSTTSGYFHYEDNLCDVSKAASQNWATVVTCFSYRLASDPPTVAPESVWSVWHSDL